MSFKPDLIIRVLLAIGTGGGIVFAGWLIGRLIRKHMGASALLYSRTVFILGAVIGVFFAVMSLGFSWKGALATAGVTGTVLALLITFVAQTSISNFISGYFLLLDKSFKEGDVVEIGDTVGIVLEIGFLSVKLRTFDNIVVRIPNTEVLNKVVKNLTAYEIRRIETAVNMSYKGDPERAISAIREALAADPLFLANPEPIIIAKGFGDHGIRLRVMAWIDQNDFFDASSRLVILVKEALESAGIEIPLPQVVVHHED
ncbi:MAG: mechanosensitive ion channel family protein [candidate division WOR-3 bacterium]